jgi:hypothetical protein
MLLIIIIVVIVIIIALCYVYVCAIDYYASPNALINHENWAGSISPYTSHRLSVAWFSTSSEHS